MGFGNTRPTPVDFWLAIATTSIVGLQQRRTTDMTAIRRFISADGSSRRVQHPPDHWLSCRKTAELCQAPAVCVSWRRRSGVRSDRECRRQLRRSYDRDEGCIRILEILRTSHSKYQLPGLDTVGICNG